MRLTEAVNLFGSYLDTVRSANTARTYRKGVGRFVDYAMQEHGQSNTSDLRPTTFTWWLEALAGERLAPKTKHVFVCGVKSFAEWMYVHELVPFHLPADHRFLLTWKTVAGKWGRTSKLKTREAVDAVERVLAVARTSDVPNPELRARDLAIVELLASTGCRVSELVGASTEELSCQDRRLLISGKGNKTRIVFFSPRALTALSYYWRSRSTWPRVHPIIMRLHDSAPLGYKGFYDTVRLLAEAAGLEPGTVTPHTFRHYFGTRMLEATGDLAAVQDLLGHASPATTRIYAKVGEQRMKELHEGVWK